MASGPVDATDFFKSQKDFEDIEPYLDMSPIQIDEQSLPVFKPDFSSAVIIDNIPVIGQDKFVRLQGAIMKCIKQAGQVDDSDLYIPTDADGNTLGFCFVKFANNDDASLAVKVLNNYAFDKKHTFKVSPYSALDEYANVPDDFVAPPMEYYPKPAVSGWLCDVHCRDQFAIRHADETEIYFSNPANEEVSLVYGGAREKVNGRKWCELKVDWSPQGTYFVTFHKPGVKLWGGDDFSAQAKFMHPMVDQLAFSPCERYLVTYKCADAVADDTNDAIAVWDVRTGIKLKSFSHKNPLDPKFQVKCTITEDKNGKKVEREVRGRVSADTKSNSNLFTIEEGNLTHVAVSAKTVFALQDPNELKWSPDGNYLARLTADAISVYELPTMALLEKKSIAAKDVSDFSWSPKSNVIAYWSPAVGNLPATINLLSIPDRQSVSSRKLFDVTEGKLVWQNNGDYLAVYLTKMMNKRKSYVLMIFRVKGQDIPVEQVEYSEPILNVSWEHSGDRLAVMTGEERNPTIEFFSMIVQPPVKPVKGQPAAAKSGLIPFHTKTGFQCSEMHWAPGGGVLAFVHFTPDACAFELFDVETKSVLASRRHDRGNQVAWDPSGRYFATCTITELRNAHAKGRVEDGINFYNFQGAVIYQYKKEKLHGFSWRPRPKGLLTAEEKKKVLKNLKKYEKEFLMEDKLRKQELNKEIQAVRFKLAKDFLDIKNRNRTLCAQLKAQRVEVRGGYDSDDEDNYYVETVLEEQVLKTTETIVVGK
jgi:translation initiation factor 3 subunit B